MLRVWAAGLGPGRPIDRLLPWPLNANVLYNLTRWDEKKFGHGAEVLMFWK